MWAQIPVVVDESMERDVIELRDGDTVLGRFDLDGCECGAQDTSHDHCPLD